MELTNEFSLKLPLGEAWALLTDLERVAPCLPGCELEEVAGSEYRGAVVVKVGPMRAHYRGVASFQERDAANHRAVVRAEGREARGQGNASAIVTATLEAEDTGTHVTLHTDLKISGKVAQFGRGVLAEVSSRLLGQFVQALEADVLPRTSRGLTSAPIDANVHDTNSHVGTGVSGASAVYYDPYKVEINADPYPVFRRLREEAPLYYNDAYDFYAASRFADVQRGLSDHDTFISGRGAILEMIKAAFQAPPGVFIFEDPPVHSAHRGVLKRVFTPRKMEALEPKIREFCARCLDPLVGAAGFDFVADLGAQMPMAVIGMLLGIPEEDQASVREQSDANLRTQAGQPMRFSAERMSGAAFEDYIEWRTRHPSDDLMTELLGAEFEDEAGRIRKLTRQEVLVFVQVLAGAGNETTNRLIGWTGKLLAEHPDQRRELRENPALIPDAIEEILRYEPPAPHVSRYVARDVEVQGQVVPQGSAMMFLLASANRDDRKYPDGDRFDVHRHRQTRPRHLSFGWGAHACLGAALARVEGRIALEEILQRFPAWEVDTDRARLSSTSTVRGWETLPVFTS